MSTDDEHGMRPPAEAPETRSRRRYTPPRVDVIRTLDAVVLGGSPAAGDSGAGVLTEKPPGL
jgi:hypothetical protein